MSACNDAAEPVEESASMNAVKPVELDSKMFASQIEAGEGLAIVDFWAEWCAPCKVVTKNIEAIAAEYEGQFLVAKVDVDIASDVAIRYKVKQIPTVLFFEDGEQVGEIIGLATKESLVAELNNHLK